MIRIQSTADVAINGIKTLIYGGSGVGKTPLCATAPGMIYFSAENGLLSVRKLARPFIEISGYASLIEAYQWAAGSNEAKQFYTFCLDSLSEIAEVVLTEEKRKSKDPRKAYGEVIDQVILLARAFRDLPGKNVVVICKEEFSKDETTGGMMFGPMLPGNKLGQKLPYYFDETFRMVVNPLNRAQKALITAPSFQHTARDRSGMLAEYEAPDLTAIFKKILGIP